MLNILRKSIILLKRLKERGMSTQDIALGMTMAVMVGTVALVTANSVVLDTEEKVHIFNASTMANAAKQMVVEDNIKIDKYILNENQFIKQMGDLNKTKV